jgi:hypothetical protein
MLFALLDDADMPIAILALVWETLVIASTERCESERGAG